MGVEHVTNQVRIGPPERGLCFGDLSPGTLFRYGSSVEEGNVYIKTVPNTSHAVAVLLKTGMAYHIPHDKPVQPLPVGTVISIVVGK